MRVAGIGSALLSLALAFASPAPGQAAPPSGAAPMPYEDVIRLHAAGLSADFIVRKIGRDGVVYALTTDDIIACKKAGLPEPVIEAMLKTSSKPAAAAPAAAQAPAVAQAPATPAPPTARSPEPPNAGAAATASVVPAAAPPAPPTVAPGPPEPEPGPAQALAPAPGVATTPAPAAGPAAGPATAAVSFPDRSFAGLVRRGSEVVLFKDPWTPGTLSFRGGTLTWTDASDPTKTIALEAADLVEQFLLCPRETDFDGACWEWGVKTDSSEHRFRDAAWAKTTSAKPAEIHALVKAVLPGLPDERYRASKKK